MRKVTMLAPNYVLVASSMLFIIPSTIAVSQQFWVGYAICLYTSIISSLYHATKLYSIFWLDQSACALYTLYMIYLCNSKGSDATWIIPSTLSFLLYYGGYATQTMIWNPKTEIATVWHVFMHSMCSVTGIIGFLLPLKQDIL